MKILTMFKIIHADQVTTTRVTPFVATKMSPGVKAYLGQYIKLKRFYIFRLKSLGYRQGIAQCVAYSMTCARVAYL